MKFKHIYSVLRDRAGLCRFCGDSGNNLAVAEECEKAIKLLKWATRQKGNEARKTTQNNASVQPTIIDILDCTKCTIEEKFHQIRSVCEQHT